MELLKKKLFNLQHNWNELIQSTQSGINSTVNSIHNSTPFSVMFTRDINPFKRFNTNTILKPTVEQVKERIHLAVTIIKPALSSLIATNIRRKNTAWNSRHKNPISLQPGTTVMVKIPTGRGKLSFPFVGPYKVVRKTTGQSYILCQANGEQLPRGFAPTQLKEVIAEELTDRFYVERILDDKVECNGKKIFKVRWLGYPENYDTWEPEENFDDKTIISNYFNDITEFKERGGDVKDNIKPTTTQ